MAGCGQLLVICAWRLGEGQSVDDRLWEDGPTAGPSDPGPQDSLGGGQQGGRLPVRTGQPHRHPQHYASTDTLKGRLRRWQWKIWWSMSRWWKSYKIRRKHTLRLTEEGLNRVNQFEDFYHDLCHDLSVFIQLHLCKKKMKTITGCLLQSGVCQRPTLCIMLHLWNLETDDLWWIDAKVERGRI